MPAHLVATFPVATFCSVISPPFNLFPLVDLSKDYAPTLLLSRASYRLNRYELGNHALVLGIQS
jgi:hypothetical protein